VRRYLDGRPVLAHPDSLRYRAGRWMKRHRTAAIAAAIAVVGLLTGLGVALYQAQVARAHAARAERRFGEVRKLAGAILFEHFDMIRELPGATKAKESMAKLSQEYLNSLAGEADDPELVLELANAYRRLAEVQGAPGAPNLGQIPQARANFRKAVELLDRLPRAKWNEPPVLDAAINTVWRLSRLLQNDGQFEEAQRLAGRQAELAGRLYAMRPEVANSAYQYLTALRSLSTIASRRGDLNAAVKHAEEALRMGDRIVGKDASPQLRGAQAANYQTLADAVWKQGDLHRAWKLYETYVKLFGELAALRPNEQYFTHAVYFGHYKLGKIDSEFLRLNLGNGARAERHCGEYLDWAQRMWKADAADVLARQSMGFGRLCVGAAIAMRSPKDGLRLLQEGAEQMREELRKRTTQASRVNAAFVLFVLAETQAAAGQREAAMATYAESMALWDSLDGEKLSAEDGVDLMLANRQFARRTGDVERARKAVKLAAADGLLQEIVHAAEAREVLAEVSPADRCAALGEAEALWQKARQHAFTAAMAEKRLRAISLGDCGRH
ncbi:MAG: hypothetical protein JNK48_04880, partial [Bryobacterales bacterium]|nr:hypothetical protein [Bryobacterales bacterium]